MEKIDRLGWAAGFSLDAYGVTIGVRVTDARVVPRLRAVVPYGAKPSRRRRVDYLYSIVVGSLDGAARPRRLHLAYSDLAKLVRTFDFDKVVEALEHDMPLVMGARTRQWVFLHAGVVGWGGRALLLPGRSFAGKSTLVEALVRAGAIYYSDEYAVLDLQGRLHPFARPLALREAGEWKGRPVPVEMLGGRVGTGSLEVAAVVATHYRAGARTRWRRLSPGQGVLALNGKRGGGQDAAGGGAAGGDAGGPGGTAVQRGAGRGGAGGTAAAPALQVSGSRTAARPLSGAAVTPRLPCCRAAFLRLF